MESTGTSFYDTNAACHCIRQHKVAKSAIA